jgi:hypothetical protein
MTNKLARIWRRADVPEEVAVAGINLRYPPEEGWTIKSFAKEAREDASGSFDAFVAELEKTAAPFPPDDGAADEGQEELPKPEPDEPKEEEPKKSDDSEILSMLHKLMAALGLDGDKKSPEAEAPEDPAADQRPADSLPPPAEPHHGIGKGLGPQNMPAFGKTFETNDLQRLAKSRYAVAEMPDSGEKLSSLTAEANEILSVVNKRVAVIQRGKVKGEKLIRMQIGPKK